MINFDITFIRNTPLFKKIGGEEFNKICSIISHVIKTYNRNEIIIMQGEEVRNLGILKEGSVVAANYHYDGSTQRLPLKRRRKLSEW